MENFASVSILIHAALGGIALLAGSFAVVSKKGSGIHKRAGIIFYYSLLISITMSLFIAVMPGHESPFLFSIGIFSAYFILIGKRALNYKKNIANIGLDKLLIIMMILTGLVMITYPLLLYKEMNTVLAVFGTVAIVTAVLDWVVITNENRRKKEWLIIHASRITGGYIASITAFMVVNNMLPGVWDWFVPGIVGSFYIGYWVYTLKRQLAKNTKRIPQ